MMASSVILVVLFISVLIIFHEFGHLIVAKLAKIPVEAFSIGFGPVILKRKFQETEYRLSLVPLGGYIKMVGEEVQGPKTESVPPGLGFQDKPLGIRVAVIAAGPVSNLLLGFLLMFLMYIIFGVKFLAPVVEPSPGSVAARIGVLQGDRIIAAAGETIPSFDRLERLLVQNAGREINLTVVRDGERIQFSYPVPKESLEIQPLLRPVIDRVRKGSPAARLGLLPGDTVLAIGGKPVRRWDDLVNTVIANAGTRIAITWKRGSRVFSDSITPAVERDQLSEERIGQIGVWVRLPKRSLPIYTAVWEALRRTGFVVVQTFVILYKVITRQISTRAIGGPIMVAKVAYEGASWGTEYFLALWALLSINLFVVNMLPIPVLDGGRILLDLFGGIRRRRLSEKEVAWAANIGWALIGMLVIFTIFNDLLRLVRK
ncbi:MAG: RIP metalloprotease RseP [candidate division WOR-3 bacterium]